MVTPRSPPPTRTPAAATAASASSSTRRRLSTSGGGGGGGGASTATTPTPMVASSYTGATASSTARSLTMGARTTGLGAYEAEKAALGTSVRQRVLATAGASTTTGACVRVVVSLV